MTRSLSNWFPAKTREDAIKRLSESSYYFTDWNGVGILWYEDMQDCKDLLRLCSNSDTVHVSKEDAHLLTYTED